MNNGQINIDSMPTAMQLVTQEPTVPVVTALDGVQQAGGNFAGVLSGIQHVAKGKDLPDSGQTERLSIKIGKHQLLLSAGAEEPNVDLLAQLHVSPGITPASEPVMLKQEEPKKNNSTEAVPLGSEPSDVASQMDVAAYVQSGRMPEVNISTPRAVDCLQNGALVTVQPPAISVPVVKGQPEQAVTESLQAPQVIAPVQHAGANESAPASNPQPVVFDRMSEVNNPTPLAADRLQNVASATDQPVLFSDPAVKIQPEQTVAEPIPAPHVITPVPLELAKESVSASSSQPAASGRMPEENNPSPLPVDRLQNVARATDQPALLSIPPDKIQVEQTTVEPVQTFPAIKSTAPSIPLQSELSSAHQDAPVPVLSLESEVEIQLSQPQPITARATAEPAVAGNRSAGLVQEIRGSRQRPTSEQQIEKVRTSNEQSAVKDTATLVQTESTSGESLEDSDTQRGSDSNQGQSDGALNNRMLAQEISGQLSLEHQKAAAVTTKVVPTEPVRQDIPEQVMQQVKERLVQHDVKPGNQQITLTLSPDSLGELKMNLNLQGQRLSVEIITENRTVRDAIVLHTDALKESLARQNISMESFDVTTGGKGSGNQGQNQNAWRELSKQQNQQQLWTSQRGYHTAQADPPSGHVYQRQQGQTMLDIHY